MGTPIIKVKKLLQNFATGDYVNLFIQFLCSHNQFNFVIAFRNLLGSYLKNKKMID